ncbi:organic cation transporter-like protein [Clonorchis sinensis]|uniref:Organic cation transporter-like protein n=1 Tax=Clonorchis sinensis TaxID=79923 RepID=G7YSU3_CLOSI|nr:organic cation transporter-like protein [Clonorchis sinensis]
MAVQATEDAQVVIDCLSTPKPETDVSPIDELNVDELLEKQTGACGMWQWLIVSLIVLSGPNMALLPVFVNAEPNVRCRMEPEIENLFLERSISFENASRIVGPTSACSRYVRDWKNVQLVQNLIDHPTVQNDTQTEACPYGYVYESIQFQYPSSVVAEFDLVCSQKWLAPLGTSLYMIGMFFGYLFGGWFGDKYGRRPTAIGFSLLEIVAGILVSLAPNNHVYNFARVFTAITDTGRAAVLRILPLEITLAKYRGYFSSTIVLGAFFFHRALAAGFAYLVPNWRQLNAVLMSPCLLSLCFFCVLPESPRWLNSQNRQVDAVRVLQTGRRYNRVWRKKQNKSAYLDILLGKFMASASEVPMNKSTKRSKSNIWQNLKSCSIDRRHLKTLIIGVFLASTQILTLFGVILYARMIRDSVYLVVLINSLTSIPGPIIASLAYRFYKFRRLPLVLCIGITCISISIGGVYTFVWKPMTDTVLNISCNIALILYSASLVMLSTYLAELFPSSTRTRSMGIINGFGRLGGGLSPLVNQLDSTIGHGISVIIYALIAAVQFGLLFFVEDTSGENLQDVATSENTPQVESGTELPLVSIQTS